MVRGGERKKERKKERFINIGQAKKQQLMYVSTYVSKYVLCRYAL